jgi:hypothetical protein
MLCCVVPTPFELRPRLAALQQGAKRVELRYEWIANWTRFNLLIVEQEVWQLSDSEEWVILTLTES